MTSATKRYFFSLHQCGKSWLVCDSDSRFWDRDREQSKTQSHKILLHFGIISKPSHGQGETILNPSPRLAQSDPAFVDCLHELL